MSRRRGSRPGTRSFSFSGSYALSKNLTNQPENTTGLISSIPNPFDLDSLWGPSFLDRRHVVAASWVWSPQHEAANPIVRGLLNGWTLTGFHRIQSGSPLVFTMGTDVAQNGRVEHRRIRIQRAGDTAQPQFELVLSHRAAPVAP